MRFRCVLSGFCILFLVPLLAELRGDLVGELAISNGSAWSASTGEPSHVLLALGRDKALARASLRFGLGRGTRLEDIEQAAASVIQAVNDQISR